MSGEERYFHSVRLEADKCRGCTNCLKRCPTDAIRIRNNRATIIRQNCIDCGECVRICPHHAKVAVTDPLSVIQDFEYKIALPAPALYTQFPQVHRSDKIIASLYKLGFDEVFEVARAAEVVSYAISKTLINEDRPRPVISSACPAVVRLIQQKYPSLLENVIDIVSPMEAAARIAKEEFSKKHGVPVEKIGAFFISPCAAKLSDVRNPIGIQKSSVDGVIAIKDVYTQIQSFVKGEFSPLEIDRASTVGVRWAVPSGEAEAVGMRHTLCVDGIENVKHALEQIEDNRFDRLDYVELLACSNGCLGGPLTVENGYVAKSRLNAILRHTPGRMVQRTEIFENAHEKFRMTEEIEPNDAQQLTGSMMERILKAARIDEIEASMPGLDCGSCGSPSCRALARDIVNGFATEMNCIFKLNERISTLASEMVSLGASTRFSVGGNRESIGDDDILSKKED
ncbi:MAG: 4Fe-4S dicluster domain-containing protein [Clostridiales bacterium]|nr:4Fe-4S dicluster domain-containing protein [Clostridiales bacterium]